jgi:hypothetical protein
MCINVWILVYILYIIEEFIILYYSHTHPHTQGFRSYIVAEDGRTGEIVGCAQLTRIQVLSLLALLVRKYKY